MLSRELGECDGPQALRQLESLVRSLTEAADRPVLGVGVGTAAALRQGTGFDRVVMGFSMTGISIPVFVVAPVLVLLFAVKLQWLPASWTGGQGATRMLLPVIALALPQIAYVARLTRASMIDVLGSDFIRTARAQGLGTMTVVRVHALKPAMLPVLSYMGPAIAAILTGSVVVVDGGHVCAEL